MREYLHITKTVGGDLLFKVFQYVHVFDIAMTAMSM